MVRIYVFWPHNLFQTSSHPKLTVYHDSSNFASFLYDFYEVFSSETYCLMLELGQLWAWVTNLNINFICLLSLSLLYNRDSKNRKNEFTSKQRLIRFQLSGCVA